MVFNRELVVERIKEVKGEETQAEFAKRLNLSQGSISKMLNGDHMPTLDTIYAIATEYRVSIDWLMGLSDRKQIIKIDKKISYTDVIKTLQSMVQCGTSMVDNKGTMEFEVRDPLIIKLLRKARTLYATDFEVYKNWITNKLELFCECELLNTDTFSWHDIMYLSDEAYKDSDYLELYKIAKEKEDDYVAMMEEDTHSPFGG